MHAVQQVFQVQTGVLSILKVVFILKSTDSLMLKISRSLGTMGQVLFLSGNDSEVKVSAYILSLQVIPFLS